MLRKAKIYTVNEMIVNIANLIKNDGSPLELNLSEYLPGIGEAAGDYEFDSPVHFRGTLSKAGDVLVLDGELSYSYKVRCYRCTRLVSRQLTVPVTESIFKAGNIAGNDEEQHYTYEDDILVLDRIFIDNIILTLPMKEICSEDCKGLCPVCGKDLNEGPCSCRQDEINPVFSVLKDLLKNDENKKQ